MKDPNGVLACEYHTVVRAATREGWLLPLLAAHFTPCDQDDAKRLLAWIGGLPRDLNLRFTNRRGRARFNRKTRRYGISLPRQEGTGYARLRAGLVLHEAAHVLDRVQSGTFDHQEKFRRILRQLVEADWRPKMRTGNVREIYDRHRGPYSLLLGRKVKGKGDKITEVTDRVLGPLNAEKAHDTARKLVMDPNDNVSDIHVFSDSEGQFIGASYTRGYQYASWAEMMLAPDLDDQPTRKGRHDGGMELPDERDEAALLSGGTEPVRQVDDPLDERVPTAAVPKRRLVRSVPPQGQAAAGAKRKGVVLELDGGNAERWPNSKGAQIVRASIEKEPATASDLAKRLAEPLKEVGVEFPASLISRLKQGGFLREQKDKD